MLKIFNQDFFCPSLCLSKLGKAVLLLGKTEKGMSRFLLLHRLGIPCFSKKRNKQVGVFGAHMTYWGVCHREQSPGLPARKPEFKSQARLCRVWAGPFHLPAAEITCCDFPSVPVSR